MENYSSLKRKLRSLPKGYISEKTIKGKIRHYLQYRDGSKVVSKYVKDNELESLMSLLEERKTIERKLKDIESSLLSLRPLGENSISLTGDVMTGDEVVASFENGILTFINKTKAPSMIVRTSSLANWLKKRAIDDHRTNSRLLRKALRIKENDDISKVLHVHAATITDNYWFRPKNSRLKYNDIIFREDSFSETALNGEIIDVPQNGYQTPELSNIGSYEKCWKLIDGEWWMIKKGNKKELFAELFASKLASRLGIPTAEYELFNGNVRTKNFAKEFNHETISAFAGDDDAYENVFNAIKAINPSFLHDYITLMWFDALVDNVDRHNENLGILRDRASGAIVSIAPNYDNNLALYSLKEGMDNKPIGLVKTFIEFIKNNKEANDVYQSLNKREVTVTLIESILKEIEPEYRLHGVTDFVMSRYGLLKELDK